MTRVSDPGTREHPIYTGFFFYQCLQFDTTGLYLLGMKVYFEKRHIRPDDRAEIGFIDRKDQNKWTKIGETTAWNWQQGARLQWRPNSEEIVWNDRSDDGKTFVCRVYDFRTGKKRALPRPVYDLSPDGSTALTHDFEGDHQGTDYVPLGDKIKGPQSPSKTGIWKMRMDTGEAELIMPLDKMAAIAFPREIPKSGSFYIFREGWNPSGKRFITFVKDPKNKLFEAYSMSATGTDVRYLYNNPSHHTWLDDDYVFDFGRHTPPGGGKAVNGYFLFKDDGSGTAKELLWPVEVDDGFGGDGHGSFVPGTRGEWIISDTYNIHGFQYLFLFHRPTKQFVPLAKLKCNRPNDVHRVDTHPRLSRDGRLVSIDATHEGLGRQMYVIEIGHILDNSPSARKAVTHHPLSRVAAGIPANFSGEKTSWHGFDRFDFLMDEAALTVQPIKASLDEKNEIEGQVKGQLRCVVVVPKEAAPGKPWSWRGRYFDHEPQAEIELLKRGVCPSLFDHSFTAFYPFPVLDHPWERSDACVNRIDEQTPYRFRGHFAGRGSGFRHNNIRFRQRLILSIPFRTYGIHH
jgi:hypothetical protein